MTVALAIPANLQGAEQLAAALAQLQALGQRPRMLFDALGAYGEQSTRLRFKNQKGPDGKAWTPSRRAKKIGGQTLVDKARLLRSITYRARADSVEWGSNVVYAAIHQFGGTIQRAAYSSWLRLRTGRGGELLRQKKDARLAVFAKATHKRAVERRYTVEAHKIKMPARPYLGVNAADGVEILRLAAEVVTLAAQSGGPTGGKAA